MVVQTLQVERTVNSWCYVQLFETRTWCNTGDANNPTDPYYKSDWGGSASFVTIPCPVQTFNLYTSNVNATTQFFGADFVADGSVLYDHFTLRFRELGATAWQFRSITAAHIAAGGRNVGGLTTGVEYERYPYLLWCGIHFKVSLGVRSKLCCGRFFCEIGCTGYCFGGVSEPIKRHL